MAMPISAPTPAMISQDADSLSNQVVLTICACCSRTHLWDMLRPQLFRLLRSDA